MKVGDLPVCKVPGLRSFEITASDEPLLQGFFEANPEYFVLVYGEPAGPHEAYEEIHGQIPADWSFTKRWLVGYTNSDGEIVAVSHVTTDLLAMGVWHIGLFIVAKSRYGTGLAQALHAELESWAASNGANWLRLGVVQGNGRAERFWESLGYVELRTRAGVKMGKLTNTLRVMVKPLTGQDFERYLCLVPRDRREANQ